MKNGLNFAGRSNPSRNAAFSRTWTDEPLGLQGFKHLGREVIPQIVEDVGRRAIGRWLDKASETHGAPAAEAFRQADSIRRKMGLEWGDLLGQRRAA